MDNIRLNNLDGRVEALNLGLSDKGGELVFTSGENCMNHVVADDDSDDSDAGRIRGHQNHVATGQQIAVGQPGQTRLQAKRAGPVGNGAAVFKVTGPNGRARVRQQTVIVE